MSLDPSHHALVRRLRGSSFSRIHLRSEGVTLQLVNEPASTSSAHLEPVPPTVATATEVVAPAPGIVMIAVQTGATVVAGQEVASIRVHRRVEPAVVDKDGVVTELTAENGSFVEFGDTLVVIGVGAS